MNICKREDLKYIEQLADGEWIIRYGIMPYGRSSDGSELVTFTSSQYPHKPTVEQIVWSLHMYALAHKDDEDMLGTVIYPDLSRYMTY